MNIRPVSRAFSRVTGMTEATGVDVTTGEEAARESYGDDMSRKLGSTLYDRLKGLAPDALLEKPVDPATLVKQIQELLS